MERNDNFILSAGLADDLALRRHGNDDFEWEEFVRQGELAQHIGLGFVPPFGELEVVYGSGQLQFRQGRLIDECQVVLARLRVRGLGPETKHLLSRFQAEFLVELKFQACWLRLRHYVAL